MEEGKMKKKRALKEKAVVIFVAAAFIAMVLSIPLYLFVFFHRREFERLVHNANAGQDGGYCETNNTSGTKYRV